MFSNSFLMRASIVAARSRDTLSRSACSSASSRDSSSAARVWSPTALSFMILSTTSMIWRSCSFWSLAIIPNRPGTTGFAIMTPAPIGPFSA